MHNECAFLGGEGLVLPLGRVGSGEVGLKLLSKAIRVALTAASDSKRQ